MDLELVKEYEKEIISPFSTRDSFFYANVIKSEFVEEGMLSTYRISMEEGEGMVAVTNASGEKSNHESSFGNSL